MIGNSPYSVGQDSQNDNNQNVKYPLLDRRIAETYAARSTAVLKTALYDSYVRAIRWATDRIGTSGIVAFVTNASFIEASTADGLRKCLADEFSSLYIFHLRGNVNGPLASAPRRRAARSSAVAAEPQSPFPARQESDRRRARTDFLPRHR